MTEDEILEKYADVQMKFNGYYKYVFNFYGDSIDGTIFEATFGGDGFDIYRHTVKPTESLSTLSYNRLKVTFRDKTEVEFEKDYL